MPVIRGTILAAEKYLDSYKSGTEGIVVNTASVCGLQPTALLPVYSGTKAGIVQFSRSYGTPEHYKKYPVRVLTICPSMTSTNLENTGLAPEALGWYREFFPGRLYDVPMQP